MLKRLLILIVLLSGLPLFCQEKPFNYKDAEDKIVKYLYSSPDSTKAVIDYVLSQKTLHDSLKGTIYNVYGIYYSNLGKTDSAVTQYKRSIQYLRNYPRIRTMPLMNIAVAYRNKGEYSTSFKYLEESLEINKKLGLPIKEAIVYSNMASNYQFTLEYDKSIECLLKAIAIVKREGDSAYLVNFNQKLANTYLKMENFPFAKDLYEECLATFKATNDKVSHALTLINYAECLIHLSDPKGAKKALKEAILELRGYKNREHLAVAYSKLANIARHEKRYQAAHKNYNAAIQVFIEMNSLNVVMIGSEYIEFLNEIKNYKLALEIIEKVKSAPIFRKANLLDKSRFELAAAETFKNTDDDIAAVERLTTAIRLKDSLAEADNETLTQELQAKFQTNLQREKKLILEAKNNTLQDAVKKERLLMVFYAIGSITVLTLILLMLRSLRLKNLLQKEKLKAVATEKNLIQQQHLHEQELTNTQKQIIEEKQRELTSTALRMANYQDSINEIIDKFENDGFNKVSEVKKELQHLVKQKDYWKQFEARFNNLHPEFSNVLTNKYSNLTKNDIEFCSLLKLNLSNKEIASLLQISHESAITKKYRIKKKMEIKDDAEFEKVLMTL